MNKKCPVCDGQLIDKETSIKLKRYGREFTYHNVKTETCQKCGEKFFDGSDNDQYRARDQRIGF